MAPPVVVFRQVETSCSKSTLIDPDPTQLSASLVLYEATGAQGVADPSNPGFGSRFALLFWRHAAQVVPPGTQPHMHVIGVGATHAPLPLQNDAVRALPPEHDAAAHIVDVGG